jgi:hypothetical protein
MQDSEPDILMLIFYVYLLGAAYPGGVLLGGVQFLVSS